MMPESDLKLSDQCNHGVISREFLLLVCFAVFVQNDIIIKVWMLDRLHVGPMCELCRLIDS